jgi:ABC-type phosphate/phosphonate transport system substrate-binding protein
MLPTSPLTRREFALSVAAAVALPVVSGAADPNAPEPLTMLVMDPLALPLSCPCVEGYAQRKYEELARHLEKQLGRPVKVAFSESFSEALKKKTDGKADIIIGKDSVVRTQGKASGINVVHVAALTGKDGKTTQTGLVVVAGKDPAVTVDDLKGYTVYFGTADAEEKFAAAKSLLKEAKIDFTPSPEACTACSDGATKIIEMHKKGEKAATVISSYAAPLLEGCGTIKKGDLRVIGITDEVPFVAAFVNDKLPTKDRDAIRTALLAIGKDAELCKVMETKHGFVEAKKK